MVMEAEKSHSLLFARVTLRKAGSIIQSEGLRIKGPIG